MDNKKFKNLSYNKKKEYLLNLFVTIRDIYPIYDKTYNLLSKKSDLDNYILDRIYNAVEQIKQKNHEKILMKNENSKKTLKDIEDQNRKKENQELFEIEKLFT